MELTDEDIEFMACSIHPLDGDTCPCLPCKARRDWKEMKRLMQTLVSADEQGIIIASDGFSTYNATKAMKEFLRSAPNTES